MKIETEKWIITNFFSGKDEELPGTRPGEPTQAWIDGWNAGMEGESEENPYDSYTQEHHDWEDGFLAAKQD